MSIVTTIYVLLVVFGLQLLISEYFVRRLGIKRTNKGLFTAGRKKHFIIIEIILFAFLAIACFALIDYYPFSVTLSLTLFFTFVFILRGIEEWIYKKEKKGYYHEWLASISFLFLFLFFSSYLIFH